MSTDEQISALVDAEPPARELTAAVRDLEDDTVLAGRWGRYYLIGDAMRTSLLASWPMDFDARVSRALRSEPTVLTPRRLRNKSKLAAYIKPVSGMAIAASIAVVAMLGVQALQREAVSTDTQVAAVADDGGYVRRVGTYWNLRQPALESKLNSYLVDHAEHAPWRRGMLPYATLVGYDSTR